MHRKTKKFLATLHVTGRCDRATCSAIKGLCRLALRAAFPDAEKPIAEHPAEAANWYEANGYRAPKWILDLAGKPNRYANV